jgi:hypothetical protein
MLNKEEVTSSNSHSPLLYGHVNKNSKSKSKKSKATFFGQNEVAWP